MSTTVLPPPDTEPSPSPSPESAPTARLVKFGRSEGFMQTLRQRVDDYFEQTQKSRRDQSGMYVKSAVIMTWLIASYIGLVFYAASWPVVLLCCVSLGVAMSAVGFNIQHDGGHGAYSRYPIVNRMTAFMLDILGGSSYIWKRTHNVIHHSYTNVTGIDGDIDLGIIGRLSPHVPHRSFHRFQHLYLWFFYGFITFKWQFYDDTMALCTGKVGDVRVPRPSRTELVTLVLGKLIFLTLAFAVPLTLHPWYFVAACFVGASFVQGVLLSVVFQLAHCVEHAEFPLPHDESARIESEWAVHQVETTVDFGQNSRLVSWYTGGLNFQIEHHLFPQVCHLHYPALSDIVRKTAAEYDVKYHAHDSMWSAMKSHYRWLRKLAQPDVKNIN